MLVERKAYLSCRTSAPSASSVLRSFTVSFSISSSVYLACSIQT